MERDTTVIVDGLEIDPKEHPNIYGGRDITAKGKYTKRYAKDQKLYVKWIVAERKEILNKGRFIEGSDGDIYNLGTFPGKLEGIVAHLPPDEQERILDLHREYLQHKGVANTFKREAFKITGADIKNRENYSNLLSREREMIELFGRMFSPQEVHRMAVQEWKLPCSLKDVTKFRGDNLETITAKIEQFKKNFEDVRLAIKKGRIEELVWIYSRTKDSFMSTGHKGDRDFLIKILEQLRKETDGDTIKIEGNFNLKIEQNVLIHLQQDIIHTLNLSQLIISRVASRMRVSPMRMLTQLTDSIYSRFNGMVTEQDETIDTEYTDMSYPSTKPYDFDYISKQYKEEIQKDIENKDKELQTNKELQREASNTGSKAKMLEKIKLMRERTNIEAAKVEQDILDREVELSEQIQEPEISKKRIQIDDNAIISAITADILKKAKKNKDNPE